MWYNWLLLAELDGSDDSVVKKYTWGPDLSGQNGNVAASPRGGRLEGAGGIGGLVATRDEVLSKSYVHFYDGNGNTGQLILRADASTAAHYEYDAYGNVAASSGSYADDNAWRFSTKQWDDETGLGYWGERYYEPHVMGRWINRDPLMERERESSATDNSELAKHPYVPMRNAVVNRIDAIGLTSLAPTGCSVDVVSGDSSWGSGSAPGGKNFRHSRIKVTSDGKLIVVEYGPRIFGNCRQEYGLQPTDVPEGTIPDLPPKVCKCIRDAPDDLGI